MIAVLHSISFSAKPPENLGSPPKWIIIPDPCNFILSCNPLEKS